MNSEQRDSFLKDEYILLQNLYEDYDRRSITIKGWVSSGAIVAIALGFNKSYEFSYLIPIAVAIVTISIWYIETYWKLFQAALRPRIKLIEAHFRSDPYMIFPDPPPLQSYDWWFRGHKTYYPVVREGDREKYWQGQGNPWHVAFQPFVMIPYAPICALCLVSALILICGSHS